MINRGLQPITDEIVPNIAGLLGVDVSDLDYDVDESSPTTSAEEDQPQLVPIGSMVEINRISSVDTEMVAMDRFCRRVAGCATVTGEANDRDLFQESLIGLVALDRLSKRDLSEEHRYAQRNIGRFALAFVRTSVGYANYRNNKILDGLKEDLIHIAQFEHTVPAQNRGHQSQEISSQIEEVKLRAKYNLPLLPYLVRKQKKKLAAKLSEIKNA